MAKFKVGIAREEYIDESVEKAIELAGGLDFIFEGETVLVKPNLNTDDPPPATTSYEVVYQAVLNVFKHSPEKVLVGDRGNYHYSTLENMKKVGVFHAALDAGAEVVVFDGGPWEKYYKDEAVGWHDGLSLPVFLKDVDQIISLPLCKTHRLAGYSGALKNTIGLISEKDRINPLHRTHIEPEFSNRIVEVNLFIKPSFALMDATSVFVSEGPESGEFRHPNLIIASADLVSCDLVGLSLLKFLGSTKKIMEGNLWQQPQIKRAVELRLGARKADDVELIGDVDEIDDLLDIIGQFPKAA